MAILARRGNAAEPASLLGEIKLINSLSDKGINELNVTQTKQTNKNVNSLEDKPVNDLADLNREWLDSLVNKWELKAAETSSSSPRWYLARKMLAELQEVLVEGNR